MANGYQGARDENNLGKSVDDFMQIVNAHIRQQRAKFVECCNLPAEHCELTKDEVLAVRLYTGPGYQPINDFLRQLQRLDGRFRWALATSADITFT
eukprot:CAMPEP_0119302062 /NCGR_PEP_ID=MMETSP1333-20130426/3736_1 /TAXON_ID=418940 /ORGANISM="Scyphosphaera apsteinii, Strain RCC1455" /LENGTH=95 /DNA_ID=CAMNT_0007304309 /DNA_START=18 /DNA_END=301 /DNA_ORIENTATION=+